MDKIGEQLPTVGVTAASLTLVFLGFMFASWESYDAEGKSAVRARYRFRGWIAFGGMVASLLAALLGFVGMATAHCPGWVDVAGAACLAVWAGLISYQAFIALRDIDK